jgi:hypothetical protein
MDVYAFENKVIEIYNDDYSIYEDDWYIGDAKAIDDSYYGHIDIASIDGVNAFVDIENIEFDIELSGMMDCRDF